MLTRKDEVVFIEVAGQLKPVWGKDYTGCDSKRQRNDIHQILNSILIQSITLVHPVYDYDYDYPGCDSKRNYIQPGPHFDSNWFCIVQQFGIILHQGLSAYRKRLSVHQVTVGDGDALPSSTKYCQVMPSIARYYQALPSIVKYYQVLSSITK